jgi:MFS family permease
MQDAHGYTALQAGAAMIPLAGGLVLGSVSSIKLVGRLGTTRVVAAGLMGLATQLALSLTWAHDMAYWPLGLWFFGMALNMGWIMGPATGSVMSTVPTEKSGVASAMNDVTRQVGGSLGTAVIGSLISSVYASHMGGVADALPGADPAAFTDAVGIGFTVAAGIALVAAAVTLYAVWVVLHKRALRRLRAVDVTVWATWLGAAFSLPFAAGLPHAAGTAPAGALLGLLALGVVVTTVPFLLWSWTLSRLGASAAAPLLLLIGPAALVLEWAFLGEAPTAAALIGGAVTLAGVAGGRPVRSAR